MYAIASGDPGAATLAEDGPQFAALIIGPKGGHVYTVEVDEGSDISSVDLAILQDIGCQQVGSTPITTVVGGEQAPIYAVTIKTLAGFNLTHGIPGVLGDSLPAGGPRALIGRDILSRLEFVFNEPGGSWALDAPGRGPATRTGPNPWVIALTAGTAGTLLGVGIIAAGRHVARRAEQRARAVVPALAGAYQRASSTVQRYEEIQRRIREARAAGDMAAVRKARRALERWQQEYGAYAPVGYQGNSNRYD